MCCRLKGAVAVEVFKSFISSECNQIEEQLMNTYVGLYTSPKTDRRFCGRMV